jgi:hypothetical protein
MGHELTECGDGVHEIRNCQRGDWLVVKFGSNNLGRRAGHGSGSIGGFGSRGRGRGRGLGPTNDDGEDMDYEE